MNRKKLTENINNSMLSLNTILKDFDNLVTNQKTIPDTSEIRTVGRHTSTTSRSSQITRRQSQYELIQPKQLIFNDNSDQKAQIRFDQKHKEIQSKLKDTNTIKNIQLINVKEIKEQVRRQLEQKGSKQPTHSNKNKENSIPQRRKSTSCSECLRLLSMGLPTSHCVRH